MGTYAVAFFSRSIFRSRFALDTRERKGEKGKKTGMYNSATRRDPSAVNGHMPSEPHTTPGYSRVIINEEQRRRTVR